MITSVIVVILTVATSNTHTRTSLLGQSPQSYWGARKMAPHNFRYHHFPH